MPGSPQWHSTPVAPSVTPPPTSNGKSSPRPSTAETRCPLTAARERAEHFVDRVDAGDDDLELLRAATREGFENLAAALAAEEPEPTDTAALREIAIGARLMMATVLEVLVAELETILGDLKVETDPARTNAYRTTLLGILANIRGEEENLTNPPRSPQA